jgi:regulator of nucleoside diphosphate kinase
METNMNQKKPVEPDLILSTADAEALVLMLGEHGRNARRVSNTLEELIEKVQTADIVEGGPLLEDRITMNAAIRYVEPGASGGELTVTWPNAAAPDQGRISVLSPMGAALLGRRVGDRVTVALPNGTRRVLVIEAVQAAQEQDALAIAG